MSKISSKKLTGLPIIGYKSIIGRKGRLAALVKGPWRSLQQRKEIGIGMRQRRQVEWRWNSRRRRKKQNVDNTKLKIHRRIQGHQC